MSAKFLILKDILAELKRKNSITVLEEHCQEKWEVYDLLMDLTNDENFKQAYIDLSFNKSFKKNFIELANQAKKAVSKYFRRKDIEFQAFYIRTEDANRVLNINLINYNRSEPIRISDILQQERDISTLNIYCDKKHDIYAYRKGKERHYEFKEGAYYEMTSTWPVQDKDGKTVTCTMVMNVSNSGITKVLQFNGKDFESPPEEFWNLIRQNEELYIQGLSLHDAVKALLEKNKDAPAVSNLQNNEHIVIYQDEKLKDLENDAKSNPILSFTSNNVSEVNPQQIATQAIATQTEVAVQHVETQTKIGSQQAKIQSLQEVATQTEVNLQHTETQTEIAVQHVETQTGIGSQETETQTEVNLQEAAVQTEVNSQQLDQKLTKAEQEIRELNELRNNLQYRLDEAEQGIRELNKQRNDLQYRLNKANQENEKLQEERFDLKNDLDQLRSDNESIKKSKEKQTSDLEKELLLLKEEKQMLNSRIIKQEKLEQELMEVKKKVKELEKQCNDLQVECKEKERKLEKEMSKTDERTIQLNAEQKQKIQELEDAYEGKKDLEKKLKISNAEREKLKGEVNKLEEVASENEKEVDRMRRQYDKLVNDLKSQMRNLDDEHNTNLESYKQKVDRLKRKCEELESELELKNEEFKKQEELLCQEIEGEVEKKYDLLLELKFKEYEDEIERLIIEKKELNDKVQHLNNQVELLSPVIDKALANKKEVCNNNSKMFYQLTGEIDDPEKNSSFDSAFYFYSDDDHCNSFLNSVNSTSEVCSKSQREGV
ncbi:coiled-coil domain-containing protein [Wolbachia endosymbiont of Tribolium confusum]|uniref:hypothetical protein n=1 Tax=Wolbachia endosymbiont of Tribolium confusum TaxID=214474 RepID=UPI001CF214DB|nr:hypothetical protein [Wolbachia endosymbiont of Tribolium confusum]MCA7010422.1 hypothetical protein [Wolbachia endosymbiont of Tribolium confusum]